MTSKPTVWVVAATFVLEASCSRPLEFAVNLMGDIYELNPYAGPRYIDGQECLSITIQITSSSQTEALTAGMQRLGVIAKKYRLKLMAKSVQCEPHPYFPDSDDYVPSFKLLEVDESGVVPLILVSRDVIERIETALQSLGVNNLVVDTGWQDPLAKRVVNAVEMAFYRQHEYIMFMAYAPYSQQSEVLSLSMMTPATLREIFNTLIDTQHPA